MWCLTLRGDVCARVCAKQKSPSERTLYSAHAQRSMQSSTSTSAVDITWIVWCWPRACVCAFWRSNRRVRRRHEDVGDEGSARVPRRHRRVPPRRISSIMSRNFNPYIRHDCIPFWTYMHVYIQPHRLGRWSVGLLGQNVNKSWAHSI